MQILEGGTLVRFEAVTMTVRTDEKTGAPK
jgi:hypothetical protein